MPMSIEEGRVLWDAKYKEWHEANQNARAARVECTAGFMRGGNGAGPTLEQLDRALELERRADTLRWEMDQVIERVFGRR